jgi:hypothetical protein
MNTLHPTPTPIPEGTWINPHFPALRADPLALSGASRRKQTPSRNRSLHG